MEWWEAQAYLSGLRRRYRDGWSQTRWLGWFVSKCLGGKVERPDEIMQFPWEKPVIDEEQEAADIAALLERCRAENEASDNEALMKR